MATIRDSEVTEESTEARLEWEWEVFDSDGSLKRVEIRCRVSLLVYSVGHYETRMGEAEMRMVWLPLKRRWAVLEADSLEKVGDACRPWPEMPKDVQASADTLISELDQRMGLNKKKGKKK